MRRLDQTCVSIKERREKYINEVERTAPWNVKATWIKSSGSRVEMRRLEET